MMTHVRSSFLMVSALVCGACLSTSSPGVDSEGTNPTESTSFDGGQPDGSGNGDGPTSPGADGPGNDTDSTMPLAGECPLGERVGNFDIILEESYSAINGEVREALVQTAILSVGTSEGECKLIKRENPFCDPPCGGGNACSIDGQCVAFPERIEVGTVTISGLEVPVSMEPAADKRYFLTELPHPAIAPGAVIELAANGFALDGFGFGALSVTSAELQIAKQTPLELLWEAQGGEAEVRIELNIDQHGNSPATLFCSVPDTGSYTVPASVIDALIDSGTSGFPSANLYRQTIDSAEIDAGCVEFRIRARTPASVVVDGHVPCMGPGQCPEGQTCNIPIQTCE